MLQRCESLKYIKRLETTVFDMNNAWDKRNPTWITENMEPGKPTKNDSTNWYYPFSI